MPIISSDSFVTEGLFYCLYYTAEYISNPISNAVQFMHICYKKQSRKHGSAM